MFNICVHPTLIGVVNVVQRMLGVFASGLKKISHGPVPDLSCTDLCRS